MNRNKLDRGSEQALVVQEASIRLVKHSGDRLGAGEDNNNRLETSKIFSRNLSSSSVWVDSREELGAVLKVGGGPRERILM
jgi:hypothetical protein